MTEKQKANVKKLKFDVRCWKGEYKLFYYDAREAVKELNKIKSTNPDYARVQRALKILAVE